MYSLASYSMVFDRICMKIESVSSALYSGLASPLTSKGVCTPLSPVTVARSTAACAGSTSGQYLINAQKSLSPILEAGQPQVSFQGCYAKLSPMGMCADKDETQGVFFSRAVAIDKEDKAADGPSPRSDHGREFCGELLGMNHIVFRPIPGDSDDK